MKPILTVAICSVLERRNNFLPNILDQLAKQVEEFDDVEILLILDNKSMMLGEKRNHAVEIAHGEYIVFVDDDDILSEDYIEEIRNGILTSKADVISFTVNVSLNGEPYKPCYYSKDYTKDYNTATSYHRLPNHIMAVKTEHALATGYKNISYGEDADYSKRLHSSLKTQYTIDKVLYYYNFNQQTTATQQVIDRPVKKLKKWNW